MRHTRQRRKRGFTLVETVVTVGIIAALSAVVYPTVVKQFDSADPTHAAQDLNNIRTAVEAFGINVRPEQPADIEDLVLPPSDSAGAVDLTATGAAYSNAEIASWLGPYLGVSTATDPASNAVVMTTGFGGQILNGLSLYNPIAANGGAGVTIGNIAFAQFLGVRIVGLSGAAFNSINELIDGPTEANATDRRQLGVFRPMLSPWRRTESFAGQREASDNTSRCRRT